MRSRSFGQVGARSVGGDVRDGLCCHLPISRGGVRAFAKKPVLAISPHPKVAELMADLELSNYCVDARDFDASALADKFASMVANGIQGPHG